MGLMNNSRLLSILFCVMFWAMNFSVCAQQDQQPPQQGEEGEQQQGGGPLTQDKIPKEPRDFRPSMLRLYYDVIPAGAGIFGADRWGQEVQASMDFDQFFFDVEFGTQKSERGDTYSYENKGNYFRFGPEVNFLKKDTKGNSFTFGLRYGHANFSDKLSFALDSTFFGDFDVKDANPNLKANWLELTMGLNAKVWKGLYLGYTVRYKVLRQVNGMGDMAPYDVPGFGLYEDNTGVQFNFYVGWAFIFREKYPETLLEEGP